MARFRKISYNKLRELVISLRSLKDGLQPSIAFQRNFVGVRVHADGTVLASDVLYLFSRCYKDVFWFIEIDAFNNDFYFVSFSKTHLA